MFSETMGRMRPAFPTADRVLERDRIDFELLVVTRIDGNINLI
jgi:hypothetical protein